MQIEKYETQPIKVVCHCEKCEEGYMNATGRTRKVISKIVHLHKCNRCGIFAELDSSFPKLEFPKGKRIPDEEENTINPENN